MAEKKEKQPENPRQIELMLGTLLKIPGAQGWLLGTTAMLEWAVSQTNEKEVEVGLYNTLQELEKTLGILLATTSSPLPRRQGG